MEQTQIVKTLSDYNLNLITKVQRDRQLKSEGAELRAVSSGKKSIDFFLKVNGRNQKITIK